MLRAIRQSFALQPLSRLQIVGNGYLSLSTMSANRDVLAEENYQANVTVTKTSKNIGILTPETELVDNLLRHTTSLLNPNSSNIIAYSGGVDSSLVVKLVHTAFTSLEAHGSVRAVLGISNAVPTTQVDLARRVARSIEGLDYIEISTDEGTDPIYLANEGEACFACKTHLYSALKAIVSTVGDNDSVLFNGTNSDDRSDTSRVGLVAASNFSVASPLSFTPKSDIRRAAKHLGLENWNHAASPCLRSRLAFGIEATGKHLSMVERGENWIRNVFDLNVSDNMRVRILARNRAAVELDDRFLQSNHYAELLHNKGFEDFFVKNLGFNGVFLRAFKSGGIAAMKVKGGK
mmetsp:Transcript_51881/g.60646  ORF Transcript_51881/g.60646 Transcript_51881/m.60646 type:complete len:348 (-) Transcript_51881:482-1525(-)